VPPFLTQPFPEAWRIPLRGWTNDGVSWLVATYGDVFRGITDTVLLLLVRVERGLAALPWWLVVLLVALLVWLVRLELSGTGESRAGVWVTDTGTRYHRQDCAALARSTPHEISLNEAREQGLAPCDLCGPPA